VAESHGHRTLDRVRWGLVPSWAKDLSIGDRLINARAETILTSNAFKRAFTKRRCIIPADGFYEWQETRWQTQGQAAVVHSPARRRATCVRGTVGDLARPERSDQEHAPRVRSMRDHHDGAERLDAPIHNRMPVVLPESAWAEWLDGENHDTDRLHKLLVPAPADEFEAWPSRRW
jgi:putative SOS response-associated peptidase YedK